LIANKKTEKAVYVLMATCLIFTVWLMPVVAKNNTAVKGVTKGYASILTGERLLDIQIEISDADWSDLTRCAAQKKYYSCNVAINGESYKNVGIRAKGGSSLDDVVNMPGSDRFSLMLKFDKYVDGQNYHGLYKLALNNNIADNTQMKDAVTYDMCRYLGLPAPLYSYARISRNNTFFGCYLALEPVDKTFCERNYGSKLGALYEPYEDGSNGGNLNYVDDHISSYGGIFESDEFGSTKATKENVVQALKNVWNGSNIESSMDVDMILKYMAVQTMVVNLDGLTGNSGHNYFLYTLNEKIYLIPWDYNLAYGGYSDDGADDSIMSFFTNEESEKMDSMSEEDLMQLFKDKGVDIDDTVTEPDYSNLANTYINLPIDTPFVSDLENRQFFMKLLGDEDYLNRYHQYLRILAANYIQGGSLTKTIKSFQMQIGDIAGTEANAFVTNAGFKRAVSEFIEMLNRKSQAVQGQLNGELPSTRAKQEDNPDKIIDYLGIDIQAIGTQ
jgi:spore coat protein CotH